jgi:hypothetical protein
VRGRAFLAGLVSDRAFVIAAPIKILHETGVFERQEYSLKKSVGHHPGRVNV